MSKPQMKGNTPNPEPPHKLRIGTSQEVCEEQGDFTQKHYFIWNHNFDFKENDFIFQPQN